MLECIGLELIKPTSQMLIAAGAKKVDEPNLSPSMLDGRAIPVSWRCPLPPLPTVTRLRAQRVDAAGKHRPTDQLTN